MTTKPTYEELERRLKEIETENVNLKTTGKALRKSEEEFRHLFDSIPDPVVIVQENYNVLLNREFTRLLGYDQTDVEKGLRPHDLIGVDRDKKIARKRMEKRLAGKDVNPKSHLVDLTCKDGRIIPFEAKGILIQYKGRPADLVVFRDVTEHKRADELIHTLTHQLMKSQEDERQMISRELHDRVAQDLSASRIACEMILNNEIDSISEVKQKISELSETLRKTIMAVRDLSYDLRPPGLEELGLVKTLYHYCMDFSEKNRLDVHFMSAGIDTFKFNYDTEINLYRLVQEGLNNIRKHADAANATVKLLSSFPYILLRIEDDGKGFDVRERAQASSKEKRMGLQSMEERVTLLKGKMSVHSGPEKGTKIFIEIPYREQ